MISLYELLAFERVRLNRAVFSGFSNVTRATSRFLRHAGDESFAFFAALKRTKEEKRNIDRN